MIFKKKYLFIFLVLLSLFILVSCGGDDEEYEGNGEIYVDKKWDLFSTEHDFKKPVEINFWSANSAVDIHGSTMADMVEMFNEYQRTTYPDSYIKVIPSFQGGYIVQNTKLQAAIPAGTNPELAMVGVSSFSIYVDNVIDQRRIFTYDQIRDIYEGFLQFAMYRNKFLAYPFFAATNLLVVNRTMMEATGMKVPTVDEILADQENSIWTWEYAKQLWKATSKPEEGIYGLASGGPALYEAYYTQGVPIYNETATKENINNEYGKRALEYWRSLVVEGCMLNPVLDPNHGTKIQGAFSTGTVGMYFASSSSLKTIFENVCESQVAQGNDPLFELDVLPHPRNPYFYSNQSGGGIIVFNNKSDVKIKAAVEFLRWLQAPEQSAYYSTKTGYLATTKSATQTKIWTDYAKINPLLDWAIDLMVLTPANDLKIPIGRAKALADDDFSKYIKGIYYDDCTRDIDEVLRECAERVAYILESNSW